MNDSIQIAILGAGNIGTAIAKGIVSSGKLKPEQIGLTRRKIHFLKPFEEQGFKIFESNIKAAQSAKMVLIAVEPQQINGVLKEISNSLNSKMQTLISVASGVAINHLRAIVGDEMPIIRVMPNTAIAIQESMTCLAFSNANSEMVKEVNSIFESVGKTLIIDEEQMTAATALGACGIAFFLRAVRAASQGGIEIGFHSEDAMLIAAQTAKGAVELLLNKENHPESEIDKVTTPRGCTISGLNQMEHEGFSSAMIKGIITSADKASHLYKDT